MQEIEIRNVLMALTCETEKVLIVCTLCFMLMHVFDRINVVCCNLTMNTLACRADLALNFVEKASLILVSKNFMCGFSLIQ